MEVDPLQKYWDEIRKRRNDKKHLDNIHDVLEDIELYRHHSNPPFREAALNDISRHLEMAISREIDKAIERVHAHFDASHIIRSEGVVQVIHEKRKMVPRYLVAWKNDKRPPTWFPESYFDRCPSLLKDYRDKWQRDMNKDLCYVFTLASCLPSWPSSSFYH